jgi:hypothetical protein
MPEVGQIKYDLKEITAVMLRDQGIRSGLWMIWSRFAHVVTNIGPPEDESGGAPGPAGPGVIAILTEVGIQRVDKPGPLSVDASQVWGEKKPERARERGGGG